MTRPNRTCYVHIVDHDIGPDGHATYMQGESWYWPHCNCFWPIPKGRPFFLSKNFLSMESWFYWTIFLKKSTTKSRLCLCCVPWQNQQWNHDSIVSFIRHKTTQWNRDFVEKKYIEKIREEVLGEEKGTSKGEGFWATEMEGEGKWRTRRGGREKGRAQIGGRG